MRRFLASLFVFFAFVLPFTVVLDTPAFASAVGTTTTTNSSGTVWYVTPTFETSGWDVGAYTAGSPLSTSTTVYISLVYPAYGSTYSRFYARTKCGTGAYSGFSGSGYFSGGYTTANGPYTATVPSGCSGEFTVDMWLGDFSSQLLDGATFTVGPSAPLPAYTQCASGLYTATGSYSGTTLSTRITMGTGTFPASGFRIDAPNGGVNVDLTTTPTATITTDDAVDGYPGTYYRSVTVSSLSSLTERITALTSSTVGQCFIPVGLINNQISSNPNDTTGADNTNPPSSTSCGFSLNPLNYIKCLFWPTQSGFTAWSSRIDTLKTEPPINVMVSGYTLINDSYSTLTSCKDTAGGSGFCRNIASDPLSNNYTTFQAPDSAHTNWDPLYQAGQFMQTTTGGQVVYDLIRIGLWVGFAFFAWSRVSAAFGDKA